MSEQQRGNNVLIEVDIFNVDWTPWTQMEAQARAEQTDLLTRVDRDREKKRAAVAA